MTDTQPGPLSGQWPARLRRTESRIRAALGRLGPDWRVEIRENLVLATRRWPHVATDAVAVVSADLTIGLRDFDHAGPDWGRWAPVEHVVNAVRDLGDAWAARLTTILTDLTDEDPRWQVISSPNGVQCVRGWEDESVDTLFISGPLAARLRREAPDGREVSSWNGSADHVIGVTRAMPAPSDPDAPDGTDHPPGRSDRWGD